MTPEQFLQIAEALPEAALLVRKSGEVLAANRAAGALGFCPSGGESPKLADLAADAQQLGDYLRLAARSREPIPGAVELRQGDGNSSYRCYGSLLCPGGDNGDALLMLRLVPKETSATNFAALNDKIEALTAEIHRRQATEEQLRQVAERHRAMEEHLTALMQASNTLTGTLNSTEVLGGILRLSQRLLTADAYAIWRYSAESGQWTIAASDGLSEAYQKSAIQMLQTTPGMLAEPVVADDVFAMPVLSERRALYEREGIRSLLVAPLRLRGDVCGTIAFYHRRPHAFTDVEVRVGTAVANLAAASLSSADLYLEQARLRAEAQTREQWLSVTLASICDAVITTGIRGRVRFLNPAAEALTGWSLAEARGRELEEVLPIINDETRQPLESPCRRVLRDGMIVARANHTVLIARDGREIPIDDSAAPIRDAAGNVAGVVLVFRDVSERKRAQESRRHLAAIIESSADAIVGKSLDGIITSWNAAAERLCGYSADEVIGRPFSLLVPPDRSGEIEKGIARLLRGEQLSPYETVRLHKDGSSVEVSMSYSPIRDESGRLVGVSAIARDISERKRAERALQESEEKLRLMADTIEQLAWMATPDGHIFWYNRRWYEYTGTSPAEVEGWGWQRVHDAQVLPEVIERWKASLASGEPFSMVFPLRGADGRFRPFLTRINPLRGDAGEVRLWFGTHTDISEQKRAEKDSRFLADASATLAAIVDYRSTLQKVARLAVPSFADWCTVDMLDSEGTLQRVAVAHVEASKFELAHELYRRFPPDKDAPRGVWNIIRTRASELVSEISDDLLAASTGDPEHLRVIRELGLRSYMGVPLIARGKVLGVITFIAAESLRRYDAADLVLAEDLAHRAAIAIENARLYAELKDADRRKDEFLATLAHELRNPLAPIRNSLQVLKMPVADRQLIDHSRQIMERQLGHLVRLVDDLLDVSRVMRGKIELRKERIDLIGIVAHALETAQPTIDSQGHQLELTLPGQPLEVEADAMRLAQVISNLLSNAAKYTPRGGRIWLCAERENGHAVLRVRDNGLGIAPEMLGRVFDLFVQVDNSVARAQGGLGIGLTLVRSLLEMHGGHVTVRSDGLGQGSEFTVRLPLAAGSMSKPSSPLEDLPKSGTKACPRRVLIVDDNVDAAKSLATLLRLGGHQTAVAHDGACALVAAREQRPEIIFLDIGMPGMDGYDVARQLRQEPALDGTLLVALTGWGQQEDRRRSAEAGFDVHLVKPIDMSALDSVFGHARLASAPPAPSPSPSPSP
jgi:PAS domain S-box-containing protein